MPAPLPDEDEPAEVLGGAERAGRAKAALDLLASWDGDVDIGGGPASPPPPAREPAAASTRAASPLISPTSIKQLMSRALQATSVKKMAAYLDPGASDDEAEEGVSNADGSRARNTPAKKHRRKYAPSGEAEEESTTPDPKPLGATPSLDIGSRLNKWMRTEPRPVTPTAITPTAITVETKPALSVTVPVPEKEKAPPSNAGIGLMQAAMAGSRWRKQTYAKFAVHLAPFVSHYLQEEVMSLVRVGQQRTMMMGETKGGTKWDIFPGAVLVADISGFTQLTERLTKKGPGGIELLTKCINSYFDLIIGTVKAHGGDVIKFAGDAVICLFKHVGPESGSPEEQLDNAVQAAVCAAASLAGHLGRMQMQPDGRVVEAPRETNQIGTHRAARLIACLEKGEDAGTLAVDPHTKDDSAAGSRQSAAASAGMRSLRSAVMVSSAFGRTSTSLSRRNGLTETPPPTVEVTPAEMLPSKMPYKSSSGGMPLPPRPGVQGTGYEGEPVKVGLHVPKVSWLDGQESASTMASPLAELLKSPSRSGIKPSLKCVSSPKVTSPQTSGRSVTGLEASSPGSSPDRVSSSKQTERPGPVTEAFDISAQPANPPVRRLENIDVQNATKPGTGVTTDSIVHVEGGPRLSASNKPLGSISMRDRLLDRRSCHGPSDGQVPKPKTISVLQKTKWGKLRKIVGASLVARAFGYKSADGETVLANRLKASASSKNIAIHAMMKTRKGLSAADAAAELAVIEEEEEADSENPKLALKVSVAAGNICVILVGGGFEDNVSTADDANQRWECLIGDPLPKPVDVRMESTYSEADQKERAEARKGVFAQIASVEGAAESGDVVMTSTCAALVKGSWIVEEPGIDGGGHRLLGLVSPGLDTAQRLVARSNLVKGLRKGCRTSRQIAGDEMAAVRAAAAASAAKVASNNAAAAAAANGASKVLTSVSTKSPPLTSKDDTGDNDAAIRTASSPTSTSSTSSISTSPPSKGSPATSPKAALATTLITGESTVELLPLLRDMKSLGGTGGAAAVRSVRTHIPNPVRLRIEAGHQDFVNETRVCTCMFVGFTRMANTTADTAGGVASVASATAIALEGCVRVLQGQVRKHEGTLLQIRCDEKGYLAICAWGLPGRTHKDNCARAISAAVGLTQELRGAEGSPPGAVAGVTTGQLLCAVVRGAQRAEYTVFGDAINLSARLMCAAKGGMGLVLTDEPTQQLAKRAALFRKLTPLPVKGKAEMVQVYAVKPHVASGVEDGSDIQGLLAANTGSSVNVQLKFVGRATEMAVVEETCERILTAPPYVRNFGNVLEEHQRTSVGGTPSGRGAFIAFHGSAGVGKTRMLREAAEEVRKCGFVVLEPAVESESSSGGRVGRISSIRLWRTIFIDACRLLPGNTPVSIPASALGKWTGTPFDLATEIAITLGLDESVVPILHFEVNCRANRSLVQRSLGTLGPRVRRTNSHNTKLKQRSGTDITLDCLSSTSTGVTHRVSANEMSPKSLIRRTVSRRVSMAMGVIARPSSLSRQSSIDGSTPRNSSPFFAIALQRDAGVTRDAVIAAFAATLAAAAVHGVKPLALVIEECDKLDSSGWSLLRKLCSIDIESAATTGGSANGGNESTAASVRGPPRRCFIIVTHCPLNPSSVNDQALTSMRARRLLLEPLNVKATQDIVVQLFGGREIDLSLAQIIHAKTSGIPLYIQQFVAFLEHEGEFDFSPLGMHAPDVAAKKDWTTRLHAFLQSTDGLNSMLTSRIDALPAQEQLTLKVASILSGEVLPAHLYAMHPLQPPVARLGSELAALVAAGFLRAVHVDTGASRNSRKNISAAVIENLLDGSILRFEFITSLLRRTAYALIPATTRQNFHIALASAAAGLPSPVQRSGQASKPHIPPPEMDDAEIAYHFTVGVDGRVGEPEMGALVIAAAWFLERVGKSALAAGAGEEAAGHFEKAIQLVTAGFAGSDRRGMTLPEELGGWITGSVPDGDLVVERRVTPERFASWWRLAAQGWLMANNHNEALRSLSGVASSIGAPPPSSGSGVSSGCFFAVALGCCGSLAAPYVESDEFPELAAAAAVLASEVMACSGDEQQNAFDESTVKGGIEGLRTYALFLLDMAGANDFGSELAPFKQELLEKVPMDCPAPNVKGGVGE